VAAGRIGHYGGGDFQGEGIDGERRTNSLGRRTTNREGQWRMAPADGSQRNRTRGAGAAPPAKKTATCADEEIPSQSHDPNLR
jgi:hypothetical protein